VRSSSRVKGQFKGRSSSSSEKAVPVGFQERRQPSRWVRPGRRVGPVGPGWYSRNYKWQAKTVEEADSIELPALSKKLFQVTVISCGL
jgi:hypothetical protein